MEPSEPDVGLCPHADIEFLGEDKSRNRYSLCQTCGSVLIHDKARVWVIRPGGPAESQNTP